MQHMVVSDASKRQLCLSDVLSAVKAKFAMTSDPVLTQGWFASEFCGLVSDSD